MSYNFKPFFIKYSKIQSLFKHDDKKIIIPKFTSLEFQELSNIKWECTEKVDGMNIRICYAYQPKSVVEETFKEKEILEFKRKTDNANIPSALKNTLSQLFTKELLKSVFIDPNKEYTKPVEIVLFGKSRNNKIRVADEDYLSNSNSFILFDVAVKSNKSWFWLKRSDLENVAKKLNIDIVPIIGYFTIPEIVNIFEIQETEPSISENKNSFIKRLILKTKTGLLNENGNRIISKVEYKDFKARNDAGYPYISECIKL